MREAEVCAGPLRTFYPDAGGLPGLPPLGQQFLPAFARDFGNGLGEYLALCPGELRLHGGRTYWFSVANLAPGWTWANPAGPNPTLGTQHFFAAQAPGEPPWNTLDNENFAFLLWPPLRAPAPATLAIIGGGLGILALARRRASRRKPMDRDHQSS